MTRRSKLERAKGRRPSHSFVQLPHYVLRDPKFRALSPHACKAVLFLAAQYNGNNNGVFGIAWKIARLQGWTSKGDLHKAMRELCEVGFARLTRQGGRNRCSLFALTWFPIDECGGKHDMPPTRTAPQDWRSGNSCAPVPVQVGPEPVQSGEAAA